ncbi:MAG: SpoIIE family protein phosphatase [Putridiphycobacter sp.]|nr:SpoIIE family protein phosphatase [Putridiphycobacter sp.]
MIGLLTSILYLGLSGDEDSGLKRTVILTNRLILLTLLFGILYIPIDLIFISEKVYIPMFVFPFAIGALFAVMAGKRYQLAAGLLILISSIHVAFMSVAIAMGSVQLFFIPLFMFNLTLLKKKAAKILLAILIVALFFFAELDQYFRRFEDMVADPNEFLFTTINICLVFVASFYSAFHFKSTNLVYEKDIISQSIAIQEQHQKLEKVHAEIQESIQYAKRIQTAILPPPKLVKKYLEDSFIIYEPKDIISGDFYWTEIYDDRILYAVADCTGHGVSGAMISVVCHNALNRAVREFKLLDPAEIFEKTREIIISDFQTGGYDIMDGMDIALVSIPLYNNVDEAKEIKYAGANSPLYLIRNGMLKVYPADRQPIARFHAQFAFSTRSISVQKGDMVYIFTDGFVNQFGGKRGKKMKYERFRELLLHNANLDVGNQSQNISQSFYQWKGSYDQVDDVCMIGVKI